MGIAFRERIESMGSTTNAQVKCFNGHRTLHQTGAKHVINFYRDLVNMGLNMSCDFSFVDLDRIR